MVATLLLYNQEHQLLAVPLTLALIGFQSVYIKNTSTRNGKIKLISSGLFHSCMHMAQPKTQSSKTTKVSSEQTTLQQPSVQELGLAL